MFAIGRNLFKFMILIFCAAANYILKYIPYLVTAHFLITPINLQLVNLTEIFQIEI